MIHPLKTITAGIKGRFYQLTYRVRKYFNPRYLARLFNNKIKRLLLVLFDYTPKDASDYYSFGRWLVSKKLAILLVLVVGMFSTMYLLNFIPAIPSGGQVVARSDLSSYRYNDIRLRGFTGKAQLLGRGGRVYYQGELKSGKATGAGTLYNWEGSMVYTGSFDNNLYHGQGRMYYPDGGVCYQGEFTNNLYHGQGVGYDESGVKRYEGAFAQGLYEGEGTLYSSAGSPVYRGPHHQGAVDVLQFLGVENTLLGQSFVGAKRVYVERFSTTAVFTDLSVVYEVAAPLDGTTPTVSRLYATDPAQIGAETAQTSAELRQRFGAPLYYGDTTLNTAEYCVLEELERTGRQDFAGVYQYTSRRSGGELYTMEVEQPQEIYLESYSDQEYLYTFYFADRQGAYCFYSVAKLAQ